MTKHERWEEIAKDLGGFDCVKRADPLVGGEYVPNAVDAETACKRIAALEAERDRLRGQRGCGP